MIQNLCNTNDLFVFCHLRWNFVFQRPQHLMSRFAKYRRVFFIEESIIHDVAYPKLEITKSSENVNVIVPHLPEKLNQDQNSTIEHLLNDFIVGNRIKNFTSWYYTPMALNFTRYLKPDCCIYDCMDELSKFKGAPEELIFLERELLKKADLVFTGGQSLYEAKKHMHENIHYLGKKDYGELPSYLATWDCAIMPFALNDSTRFISPTKTPEFLAAGCPVGLGRVDNFLKEITWDEIWNRMSALENNVIRKK
ncbi:MAG: hypothetical protein ACXVCL_05670 [Bdellovibrio sp.]